MKKNKNGFRSLKEHQKIISNSKQLRHHSYHLNTNSKKQYQKTKK